MRDQRVIAVEHRVVFGEVGELLISSTAWNLGGRVEELRMAGHETRPWWDAVFRFIKSVSVPSLPPAGFQVHSAAVDSLATPAPDPATVLFRRLPPAFFDRATMHVARQLLGAWLVRRIDSECRVGRIVETEAYLGPHDQASHSSKGCTPRNRSMFGPPGRAYVYRIYGIHDCFNVVTEREGHGAAVLVRALEPVHGIAANTRGPGLLCRAMSIDRSLDGADLLGDSLFLAEPATPSAFSIVRRPRIGVDYAGAWARRQLRFLIRDNPWVSRR